jgi:hypothetical protein
MDPARRWIAGKKQHIIGDIDGDIPRERFDSWIRDL